MNRWCMVLLHLAADSRQPAAAVKKIILFRFEPFVLFSFFDGTWFVIIAISENSLFLIINVMTEHKLSSHYLFHNVFFSEIQCLRSHTDK